jgi:hypothetical protein
MLQHLEELGITNNMGTNKDQSIISDEPTTKSKKYSSRESNPGRKNGNLSCYHYTTTVVPFLMVLADFNQIYIQFILVDPCAALRWQIVKKPLLESLNKIRMTTSYVSGPFLVCLFIFMVLIFFFRSLCPHPIFMYSQIRK